MSDQPPGGPYGPPPQGPEHWTGQSGPVGPEGAPGFPAGPTGSGAPGWPVGPGAPMAPMAPQPQGGSMWIGVAIGLGVILLVGLLTGPFTQGGWLVALLVVAFGVAPVMAIVGTILALAAPSIRRIAYGLIIISGFAIVASAGLCLGALTSIGVGG